jgi:hypothetical protein
MAMEPGGQPIEDWIQRYRNNDAPDNDRQKWSDQDQRPVAQEPEADNSNCQDDERFIQRDGRQRAIIVFHCAPLIRDNGSPMYW